MEQLIKAYEAIEMLKALDLPVSEEQFRGVAKLEKEYLQEEIIPLLKQKLESKVRKVKGKFKVEVNFDKDNGLSMNVMDDMGKHTLSTSIIEDGLSARDTSKYSIDGGEPLNKRRFVLAVIKKYVESHPGISYGELKQLFPDELSGSPLHGVIRTYRDVKEKIKSQPDLNKRFFLNEDDLIILSDGLVLTVYNQWGTHFSNFLEVAEKLFDVKLC